VGEATVVVRYFAAARAAAGVDEETLTVPDGTTVADLVAVLRRRGPQLDKVLQRCSYLCDSIAIRDARTVIEPGQTLDVLPPFAGG
jgi:molybdopterin converting factor small subunit